MNIAETVKKQTDRILRQKALNGTDRIEVSGVATGTGAPAPTVNSPAADLTAHKASADHDGRYYTEGEVDGMLNFVSLSDTPAAYTGQGSKLVAVKADVSGLEFVAAPPATNGVPIGGTNNQLLAKDGATDYVVKWMDAPAASNGIPQGGSAGQVLEKIDGTDYNAQWADPAAGSPLTTKGDVFVYGSADARLPVGTDGQVLTADAAQTLGVKWATPSGGAFYENAIDEPPASPSAWDDEFEGSTLNGKWSWVNQRSCVATVDGKLHLSDAVTDGFSAIVQEAPEGDFVLTVKHELFSKLTNYHGGGIALYDLTNDKVVYFINQNRATNTYLTAYRVTPVTNTTTTATIGYTAYNPAKYLRARVESGTIYFEVSNCGKNWLVAYTESVTAYLSSITHIGIGTYRVTGTAVLNTFDWFRVTE